MTWFIFIGDMLVMLFMVIVAAWVFYRGTDDTIKQAARIPLEDEHVETGAASPAGAIAAKSGDPNGKPAKEDSPDA